MQLIANQQLVRNRARLGTALLFGAMAVFALGLYLSTNQDLTIGGLPAAYASQLAPWASILVGMLLYALGQSQLRRWGPGHRQQEALGQAIRGLDDRYKLYAFLATNLPDYILVSPAGVHVLVARHEAGQVSCTHGRWRRSGSRLTGLFEPGLGNPSADAERAVQRVKALLAEDGKSDIPVGGMVVFTHPRVQLRVEGCSLPVTRLAQLKDVLRRAAGKGQNVVLNAARVRETQALFDRRMQAAHGWR